MSKAEENITPLQERQEAEIERGYENARQIERRESLRDELEALAIRVVKRGVTTESRHANYICELSDIGRQLAELKEKE